MKQQCCDLFEAMCFDSELVKTTVLPMSDPHVLFLIIHSARFE